MTDLQILDFDINAEWSDVAYDVTCFFMSRQTQVSQGLLIVKVSKSRSARHITLGRTHLEE